MFAELKSIVDLICSCVSGLQKYKSGKVREKLILDLLRTYFLMKDSAEEGKQLIDEAGPDPIRRIKSMNATLAVSTLNRWEVILYRQSRRLNALHELMLGQNYLALIDPDTQARIKTIVGYKLERTNSLYGIAASLFFRFVLSLPSSVEDRASYVSIMFGSQSELLDVEKIEQEIDDLRESLDSFRGIVERLLSDDEITKFSDRAREKTLFE